MAQGAFSAFHSRVVKAHKGWPSVIGEDIVMTWALIKSGWRLGFEPIAIGFTSAPTTFTGFYRQRKRGRRYVGETLLASHRRNGRRSAIGFSQLADRHTSTFPTGQLRVDARVLAGSIGAGMTREVLSDTAELVQNRIRMTTAGLNLQQNMTERLAVQGRYNYKSFSDGNHANELQWSTQYALYLTTRVVIGHRFRLLDFHEQSGSGYFDPNNYIANRGFASLYFENRLYYTYLEGYLGYETYRRYGTGSNNFIHGGSGSIGTKPLANLSFEINVEGGNFRL